MISNLSVYPNPSDGRFTISFMTKLNETIKLNLFSFDGRQVWRSEMPVTTGENSFIICQPQLPSGIYLLRISGTGGSIFRKVVIH
jgi:hypothetical protein